MSNFSASQPPLPEVANMVKMVRWFRPNVDAEAENEEGGRTVISEVQERKRAKMVHHIVDEEDEDDAERDGVQGRKWVGSVWQYANVKAEAEAEGGHTEKSEVQWGKPAVQGRRSARCNVNAEKPTAWGKKVDGRVLPLQHNADVEAEDEEGEDVGKDGIEERKRVRPFQEEGEDADPGRKRTKRVQPNAAMDPTKANKCEESGEILNKRVQRDAAKDTNLSLTLKQGDRCRRKKSCMQ